MRPLILAALSASLFGMLATAVPTVLADSVDPLPEPVQIAQKIVIREIRYIIGGLPGVELPPQTYLYTEVGRGGHAAQSTNELLGAVRFPSAAWQPASTVWAHAGTVDREGPLTMIVKLQFREPTTSYSYDALDRLVRVERVGVATELIPLQLAGAPIGQAYVTYELTASTETIKVGEKRDISTGSGTFVDTATSSDPRGLKVTVNNRNGFGAFTIEGLAAGTYTVTYTYTDSSGQSHTGTLTVVVK